MKITIAKSAGFCYGVKRAIDITTKALLEHSEVYIRGNIVNNSIVIKRFEENGLKKFENINEIKPNSNVLIRAHGCTPLEIEKYEDLHCNVIDATCPNVKEIHNIVKKYANTDWKIIIIGDNKHPEVLGTIGNAGVNYEVINSLDDIKQYDKVCIVEQTTFSKDVAKKIINEIILASKEQLIYNTICKATELRQAEVKQLSETNEMVIVIGDKQSANSNRLYEIAKEINENTIFIENEKELNVKQIKKYSKIALTSGVYPPDDVIKYVILKYKEVIK